MIKYVLVYVYYKISNTLISGAPSSTSEGDRQMRSRTSLYEINSEQLLLKAFFDVMHIFSNVEPQSESNFPFLYTI